MATSNEPPQPAPPSATGGAKPISEAELSRELNLPPMQIRQPEGEPPPVPGKTQQTFREENPVNVTMGDDKGNRQTEATLPGFRDAAAKMLEKKAKGETTEPEPKKKEAKPKAEPAAEQKPKEEAKPKEDTKPTQDTPSLEDEVPEEHRKVLPHDAPQTAKRIKYFLSEKAKAESAIADYKKQLEELKAKAPTPANTEEIEKLRGDFQKTQEELTRYRRRYDLENDAEFKAKYHEPINAVENTIETTLKKYGFTDETLKVIKDEGGFGAFSRSNRTFPVEVTDPDDPSQKKTVYQTAAQLSRSWINGMNVADSEEIKASLGKQQLLRSEEQAARTKAMDEANQYFEQTTKAQQEAAAKQQEFQKKSADEYANWLKDAETKHDWLRDVEVPADATPEQKADLEARNEFAKTLREGLSKHPTNSAEYAQLKFSAAEAEYLRRQEKAKDDQIAALQEQLKKAKASMRTTPKAGSILHGGGKPEAKEELADPTDFRTALRRGVQKLTNGED